MGLVQDKARLRQESEWADSRWIISHADGTSFMEDLYENGLKYTADSKIDITVGERGVYINDGINPIHKVSVDGSGSIVPSWVGVKAPANKPRISTEVFNKQFDNSDSSIDYEEGDESGLGGIGLIRCQYTVVSETGQESNPSPASDFINAQFFKIASDGVSDERLIKSISVSDLNVPEVPEAVLDSLQYFKIYYQIIRYAEGVDLDSMEFSTQVDIKNKNTDPISTGNDYTVSNIKTVGNIISYENDTGFPCKVSATNAGVLMVGGIKKTAAIPGDFEYMTPITINNQNQTSVVDAIVKIKLKKTDIKDKDGKGVFPLWTKYFTRESSGTTANVLWRKYNDAPDADYPSRHLRMYDSDLTTPIMVYVPYFSAVSLKIYVKIPVLRAGASHTIYFCWNDADKFDQPNPSKNPTVTSGHLGIQDEYNDVTADKYDWEDNIGIHYGRWALSGDDTNVAQNRQQVFQERRVPSAGTEILTVPHIDSLGFGDDGKAGRDLSNRANTNCHGEAGSEYDPNIVWQSVLPSGAHKAKNATSGFFDRFIAQPFASGYEAINFIANKGYTATSGTRVDLTDPYYAPNTEDELKTSYKNNGILQSTAGYLNIDHGVWHFESDGIAENNRYRGLAPLTQFPTYGNDYENDYIPRAVHGESYLPNAYSAIPTEINKINNIPDIFNRLSPISNSGSVKDTIQPGTTSSSTNHYSAGAFKPWCSGWSFRKSAVNIGKMPNTGYMYTNLMFKLSDLVSQEDSEALTGGGKIGDINNNYKNSIFHVACGVLNDADATTSSLWADLPSTPYDQDVDSASYPSYGKHIIEDGVPINLDYNADNFRPTSEIGVSAEGNTNNGDIVPDKDPITNTDPTQNMFWVRINRYIDGNGNQIYRMGLVVRTMVGTFTDLNFEIDEFRNDTDRDFKNLFVYLSWDIENEQFAVAYSTLEDGADLRVDARDLTTAHDGTPTQIKDSFLDKPLYDIGLGNSHYMTRVLSAEQYKGNEKYALPPNENVAQDPIKEYNHHVLPLEPKSDSDLFQLRTGDYGDDIGLPYRFGSDGWDRTSLSGFHGFYSTTEMTTGKYSADKHFIYCLRDNMPRLTNPVGYNYEGVNENDRENNNITIKDSIKRVEKHYDNMIMWSEVNKDGLPDLNYKLLKEPVLNILSAPSFLKFEYSNTFLIFTRNTINRFVLKGTASGWSGSSESLIEEKIQYGLFAQNSLTIVGGELFWLSEEGVIRWNTEGIQNISGNMIDIPLDEGMIGFYCPEKNQYMLHNNETYITFVYDLTYRRWTTFEGLDIISSSILTGGTNVENINILLLSDGQVSAYPSSTPTSEDAHIKTMDLFMDSGQIKRAKVDYNGSSGANLIYNLAYNDKDSNNIEKSQTISAIEKNTWRGLGDLGRVFGRVASFRIENADEIFTIIYDAVARGND